MDAVCPVGPFFPQTAFCFEGCCMESDYGWICMHSQQVNEQMQLSGTGKGKQEKKPQQLSWNKAEGEVSDYRDKMRVSTMHHT